MSGSSRDACWAELGGSLSVLPHVGREAVRWELDCPHFPLCSALVEKMLEGAPDTTAPLLQLAEPFIPLYKEEQANQREIKMGAPQRTLRRGRRKGGWCSKRQRGRESPAIQTKTKASRSQGSDVETHGQEETRPCGSLPAKEEGMETDKKPCEWSEKRVERDPQMKLGQRLPLSQKPPWKTKRS